MNAYADTNFVTRLYLGLAESFAQWPLALKKKTEPFPVTWLHRAEICNAMQLYVFRSRGGGPRITPEFSSAAWGQFRDDLRAGKLSVVDLSSADLARQAEALSLKYTARHGFRVYDLLHVASALILGCNAFWSFDEKALRLAKLEGLKSQT